MIAVRQSTLLVLTVLLSACASAVVSPSLPLPVPQYVGDTVNAISPAEAPASMDALERRLRAQLASDPLHSRLRVTRLAGDILRLEIPGDLAFEAGSAQLPDALLEIYSQLVIALMQNTHSVLQLRAYGDQPDAAAELSLAERRAASVATYLREQGVPGTRLRYEGRTLDVDDALAARRVVALILPVVDGREAQAWMPPVLSE